MAMPDVSYTGLGGGRDKGDRPVFRAVRGPLDPVGGAYRKGPFPGPAPPAPGGHGPSGR